MGFGGRAPWPTSPPIRLACGLVGQQFGNAVLTFSGSDTVVIQQDAMVRLSATDPARTDGSVTGYRSAGGGGRSSCVGSEARAGPAVGASTPTSPPAMVARIVANESGTGIPL